MTDQSGDPGARPGDAPTPEGARPDGQPEQGARPDTPLSDNGVVALERERSAKREAERRVQELNTRITELEDAGRSADERREARLQRATVELETRDRTIADLQAQIAQSEIDAAKAAAALEFKLAPEWVPRLQGTTTQQIKADAKKLAESLERSGANPVGQIGIGRGGPGAGARREDMNSIIRGASGRMG